jgi:hypothetical protein
VKRERAGQLDEDEEDEEEDEDAEEEDDERAPSDEDEGNSADLHLANDGNRSGQEARGGAGGSAGASEPPAKRARK